MKITKLIPIVIFNNEGNIEMFNELFIFLNEAYLVCVISDSFKAFIKHAFLLYLYYL